MLIVERSICLSLILTFWLSKKGPRIIVASPTSMLRTTNSSKNLLISINVAKKDEVVNRGVSVRTIKNLSKSPKVQKY